MSRTRPLRAAMKTMKTSSLFYQRMRDGLARKLAPVPLLLLLGLVLGSIAPVRAQLKTPAERIVLGTVTGGSGAPLDNAVVYLQNTKTMEIRSYVTNGGGHFHFNQLLPDTDYAVWAEVNKHRSKTKTVSMFSSHVKFDYQLKIKS